MQIYIATWRQLGRTLVFLAAFFVMLFGGLALTLFVFKKSGLSVSAGATGTSIQFSEFDRKVRFDTVLIHPLDWNDPRIMVEKGDSVTVSALGNVNVALGLLNESLRKQYSFRGENQSNGKGRNVEAMTQQQIQESLPVVPWNGPEGMESESVVDKAVKSTQDAEANSRIIPNERMGRLIVAVVPGDKCPTKGRTEKPYQLLPYHSNFTFEAAHQGALCFIINDHRSDDDSINSLFWSDNIGFFVANIRIESS